MCELDDFPTRIVVRGRRRYYYRLRFPDDLCWSGIGAEVVAPIELKREDEYFGELQFSMVVPKYFFSDVWRLVGKVVFCRQVATESNTGSHYTIFRCDEGKTYVVKQYIVAKDVDPSVPATMPCAGVVSEHDDKCEFVTLEPIDVSFPEVVVTPGKDVKTETVQGHLRFVDADVDFEKPLSWRHKKLRVYNHVITGDFSAVRFMATVHGAETLIVAIKPWSPLTIKSGDHETVKLFRKTGILYHYRPISPGAD